MNYLPDGTVIPTLVEQVPTVENGLLKEDLTGFTATLKAGVALERRHAVHRRRRRLHLPVDHDPGERLRQHRSSGSRSRASPPSMSCTFEVAYADRQPQLVRPVHRHHLSATSCRSTSWRRARRRRRPSTRRRSAPGRTSSPRSPRTTRSSTRPTRTTASRTSPSSRPSTSRAAATPPRPPGPSSRRATGTSPGTSRSSRPSSTS